MNHVIYDFQTKICTKKNESVWVLWLVLLLYCFGAIAKFCAEFFYVCVCVCLNQIWSLRWPVYECMSASVYV